MNYVTRRPIHPFLSAAVFKNQKHETTSTTCNWLFTLTLNASRQRVFPSYTNENWCRHSAVELGLAMQDKAVLSYRQQISAACPKP